MAPSPVDWACPVSGGFAAMVNTDGDGGGDGGCGGPIPMCVDGNAGVVAAMGVGVEQGGGAGPQDDGGIREGQGSVSMSGDEMGRRGYAGDAEMDEAATVQGSKEGTEDLLRKVVYSEEEAYKLYCDYGHCMGFSVRKGKQSYFTGTKKIRTKDYFCSKEGLKEGEKLTDLNFNDPHSRTNCKAMVRYKVNEVGEWKVTRLVSDHNHNLTKPEERHLLRSARSLIAGRSSSVEAMLYGGYQIPGPPSQITLGGTSGINNTETSKQDLIPCYTSVAKTPLPIGNEDLQSLVSHLKSRANEDGMFFWDVQIDRAGRMTNFFWRDGRSRIDYDCFGDVLVFDSTYRLNKQNLICAPFVGVNHHWQSTMYGCALLADESMSSFVWLFKSFLEAMGNRHPRSIFTNQDQVMSRAIEQVFPNTCHRISRWHIQKNAASRLGGLNGSKEFNKLFTKCMQGCNSEAEFVETWAEMRREFKLDDNRWLKKLYKLKQKWCSALNKHTFDGGVEYEPQCDSLSNIFNCVDDKLTLSAIVIAVDKLTEDWRGKEFDEDMRCWQKPPACIIKHSDILNHAAKVYTHRIYKLFETYFLDGCGATKFKELHCDDSNACRFEMTMQGRGSRIYTVHFDMTTMQLNCTCSKFETMGLLCPHALKALSIKNVCSIPETYILKRWTKEAKKWVFNPKQYESSFQECMDDEAAYCNHIMRYAYDLVVKSQGNRELRKSLWDTLESGEKELEKYSENATQYALSYAT